MKRVLGLIIISLTVFIRFANATEGPCSGPSSLLNIIDRPTYAGSACVVPFKKLFIQSGFQYQQLFDEGGTQQNLPNAALRLGLPYQNEFLIILPNAIYQSQNPTHGASATTVGLKHLFGYNDKWIVTAEALITPSSSSAAFGSAGTGITINGIVNYTINDQFGVLGMLGAGTQTESALSGGGRYSSVNPDVVLTYAPKETWNFFAEVYGQSQTGPFQGWGWNADFGVLYLLTSVSVIDLEVGKRLRGTLGGFEQYIGAGLSVMLD